jgi:chromate transporter
VHGSEAHAGGGPFREPDVAGPMSLGNLFLAFLKIGSIGFGGGMAVIALMEQEIARKRRLISVDEFAHGVGLAQILGAFAVNTAIFVGYRLFGLIGGLLCALAFLTPSVLLVIALSYLYFEYHSIPGLQGLVAGLGPVVIALIASAGWNIVRHTVRTKIAVVVASAATAAGIARLNTIWILLAAGMVGLFLNRDSEADVNTSATHSSTTLLAIPAMSMPAVGPLFGLTGTFLKIGCVFFGGGFVLVPLLHHHLVTHLHWLTEREFVDGVAISNLTPGPIAVLATFAGYHVASIAGALVATAALFAPGAALMLVISHQYECFREDRRAKRFLRGINPAVSGLIFATALLLAPAALASWRGLLLCGLSLLLLTRLRWHPAFVLAIGAATGYLGVFP